MKDGIRESVTFVTPNNIYSQVSLSRTAAGREVKFAQTKNQVDVEKTKEGHYTSFLLKIACMRTEGHNLSMQCWDHEPI